MTDSTIRHIATVFPINAEALKPDPQLPRRRSIIRDFGLNTSTHGIPGIARSQSIHNRVFWAIATLIFTGIMIYFVTESIIAYFSYRTQTSVSANDEWPQPFPAVSICNYAPLVFNSFIGPFINYTNSRNLTNTNDTSTITSIQASYIRDFFQYKLNNNESLDDYLFSLKSMLISCVYNGQKCSAEDFTPFLSSRYGFCYTFNAKNDQVRNGTLFSNADNGDVGLLQLQLYVHSHQYVPYFSDAVGIAAMIHDNREVPLIYSTEIYLGPGRKHRMSYTKKTSYTLGAPYSTCQNKIPYMLSVVYDRIASTDFAYSEDLCSIVCLQIYTYTSCGCVNPLQWSARSIVLPETTDVIDAPLCNITDSCYREAVERFQIDESIWYQYCVECNFQCSYIKYQTRISSLSAPLDWMIANIKTFVESTSIPLSVNWSENWPTEIPKNYVALDVACESTKVDNYTQDASISGVDLLSNIGGQTGLWIGISFLSLMELVEMLYRLLRYHFHFLKRRIRGEHDIHL